MARDEPRIAPKAVLDAVSGPADIALIGQVDKTMVDLFLDQLGKAKEKEGDIVLCITTPGGDAELVRRIVLEIERIREKQGERFHFLGKSVVYSAGVSVMTAFPRRNRFITRDCELLIHGRQLDRKVQLSGSIRTSKPQIEALLAEIEIGLKLEEEGFAKLIEGTGLELGEVCRKALYNWYLTADEALDLGLVAAIV